MSINKRITLQQAAEIIKDGSRLTFSGFTIWRRPMAIAVSYTHLTLPTIYSV